MKRGTPRHPKMYALAEALAIPLPFAVGILEMLWHHAGEVAQRGDIGSLPDRAIAEAVGWPKKPTLLIDGLVSAKWLDRDADHRLIIHDWPEHCEQSVIKWLEYNHKSFLRIYGYSLENRKRKGRDSHPSREEEAMVEAKASEKETTEKEKTPTRAREFPPGYEFDELYQRFRQACKDFGLAVIDPEDFVGFAWIEWGKLDSEQRLAAVTGLDARRISGCDPAFTPGPEKYLKKREWKRPIVTPRPQKTRMQAMLDAL